jgi:hypothetical protein
MGVDERDYRTPVWLAHWAKIISGVRAKGWTWPGFDYSDGEWRRLTALAGLVDGRASVAYQIATAVVCLGIIGVLAVGIGATLDLLPIDRAAMPPWAFGTTLTLVVFVLLVIILPLAMRIAGGLVAGGDFGAKIARLPDSGGDTALATKVTAQVRRMALFASAVVLAMVLSDAFAPPPLANWLPWIIAGSAALLAFLFL